MLYLCMSNIDYTLHFILIIEIYICEADEAVVWKKNKYTVVRICEM